MPLTIADITRVGHVTRWHSVRTLREQTLAEHLFLVLIVANRLAKDIMAADLSDSDRLKMVEYCAWHDTPELLMGDLPSPLKRKIEALTGKDNPLEDIERELAPWLYEHKALLSEEVLIIVKIADLIDALVFISHEGLGKHAQVVKEGLAECLTAKINEAKEKFPAYSWETASQLCDEMLNADAGKISFEQEGL
ncbi:MAG: YfbR-like 5'-deoxynucleotidase [Thermodesulfobacteriota bacterium]